ncbi:hypothetical protein [Exiguobacterium flavidum]|uniref:hypothetical protein n=1 Tax=Exiguobacterium flavidum TaxID=2184695 RepID=UPI000DF7980D|nr:hypothetical protein [Exiguobacterium flavidum]
MVWINIGIIVLALIGLGVYGFVLYKKRLMGDINRVKLLAERFKIRQQTLQTQVDHTTSRIDEIKQNIDRLVSEGKRVQSGAKALVSEGKQLTEEMKKTSGMKAF